MFGDPTRLWRIVLFARREPMGTLGLFIVLGMALVATFAKFVAPFDPVAVDLMSSLSPPSAAHWLGTDAFGRDVLSRIIYGARAALAIGVSSSFLGCTIGALIGVTSAYFGGVVDLVTQRFIDIVMSLPGVVLALVVAVVLGHRMFGTIDINLIFAIAIPVIPNVTRVIRSVALGVRHLTFIDAARALGFSPIRIILRHLMPNIAGIYIIMLTSYMAAAILLESSLSYLGLGVTEPTPSWGLMLSGTAAEFYQQAPWLIVFPGFAICLAVISFNLFGDSVRDWLDPKLKS
jgi:peptide/nickel transport system permease protein